MNFVIHAAGSLGNVPDHGKRAYRMRCRFRIEAFPTSDRLDKGKLKAADWFIRDMATQGWQHVSKFGFSMKGPFRLVEPQNITVIRPPRAKDMLSAILQGNKFRDKGGTTAAALSSLSENEFWEYELAGVFVHNTLIGDVPEPHEVESK